LSAAPAHPAFVLNRLLARHPLDFYFVFAFGFSWLMFLPGLLMHYGVLSLSPQAVRWFAIAGLLGPTLSGFIMTGVIEGCHKSLIAATRGRMGCQNETDTLLQQKAVPPA
jgi:hypothetical protein